MFPCEIPLTLPPFGFIHAAGLSSGSLLLARCQFEQTHWHADFHQQWQLPLPVSLQNAVVKRKAEYLASRWLAQQVMAQFEVAGFVLHNAADRSPVWPAGIQASLSHTKQRVVIAATRDPLCVGVDVEQVMTQQVAQETAELLMNQAEQNLLHRQPIPFAHSATLLFSLKESLYKALWPQLHQPMDFQQAELLAIDMARGQACLRLRHHFRDDFTHDTRLQARFWYHDDCITTLLTHPIAPK